MALEISEVKVYTSSFDTGSSVGYGMVTFCEALTIKFNVLKAKDGRIFVSWPQRKKSDGEYVSHITFATVDVKNQISDYIVSEFNKRVGITTGGKTKDSVSVVTPAPEKKKHQEQQVEQPEKTVTERPAAQKIMWG